MSDKNYINDKIGDELLSDSSPVKECSSGIRTTATITFELVYTSSNYCKECAVQRYCKQLVNTNSVKNPENDLEELIYNCIYDNEHIDYTIKVKKD